MAPAATPPKGGGGKGLSKKLGGVPIWAYAIVAGGIVGGVLWVRYKNAKAAAASSAAGSTSGTQMATEPYGYGGGGGGIGSDTLAAILASQGAGSAASSTTTSTTGTSSPTVNTTLASGQGISKGGTYTDPTKAPITSNGATYVPFASQSAANDYIKNGGTVYSEVAPGIFSPLKNVKNAGSTYVYAKA